jgi:predicted RNA binding protein YcfA (HicA-like mRNA interferase family)/predicted RNase H-like HicB family nuclease
VPKKYREVRAALVGAGWVVVRQRGSHEVWAHSDRRERIVVAGKNSDTVPVGTLGSIVGQAVWRLFGEPVHRDLRAGGGWRMGAYLPDLPGVVALGASREDAAERIQEAIIAYAEDLRERGEAMPPPHHAAGTNAA